MHDDPYGLLDPALTRDPYPTYARMRREAPVHRSAAWNAWVLTRYADVTAAFRDRRFSAERGGAFASRVPEAFRERVLPLTRNLSSWALLLDPPAHTRIRALINRAFTPRVVEAMRPRVAVIANDLVDAAAARAAEGDGTFDLVRDLANPLPVLVIGDLLGVPRADARLLKGWSDALAAFLGSMRPTPELVASAADAVAQLEDYFRAALDARRRAPAGDLLSAIAVAEENGTLLTDQEVLSTCSMLLFGGHETTTNLIGNAVDALLRHPAELAKLRAAGAPALSAAVEEVLRLESPVQRMGRVLKEDVTIDGHTLRAGELAMLMIGAANRDPEAFGDPDALDVARADNRHLAFGLGAHYCVGAALGRLEAELALGEVLRRFPALALAEDDALERPAAWLPNIVLRGLSTLRLRAGAAA